MKTYMKLMFSTEGAPASEIRNRLLGLGFQATRGNYDFIYEWDRDAEVDDLLWFADRIQVALKGSKAMFTIETV
ncbi:MAG TPA: hypothetical protein HA346_03440 [Thermoplasmata archaeon]|jgi:hypothetical protein|nr:hypothetical protein [Thermoplasmata archaeon]HIH98042.1 hypothetical protein [Thermoplasmata archaeon]